MHRIFLTFITCIICNFYVSETFANEEVTKQEKKLISTMKQLNKRIAQLDNEIKQLAILSKKQQKSLEELELEEAKSRELLADDIAKMESLARSAVRMERLPLHIIGFTQGDLRESYQRSGIMAQSRHSLSHMITEQRDKVYTLQEIRAEKQKATAELLEKQKTIGEHRKNLQGLFTKQSKILKLDEKEQAKLLVKARRAANKAKNLTELAEIAQEISTTKPNINARIYRALPVKGRIVKNYNERNKVGLPTKGVTVETTTAEPVKALADGRIIYSNHFREYGHIIILEHGAGLSTLYSGLQKSTLNVGDYIRGGQIIGRMPTEQSPELYLEVRRKGETINPLQWIEKQNS